MIVPMRILWRTMWSELSDRWMPMAWIPRRSLAVRTIEAMVILEGWSLVLLETLLPTHGSIRSRSHYWLVVPDRLEILNEIMGLRWCPSVGPPLTSFETVTYPWTWSWSRKSRLYLVMIGPIC